MSLSQNHHRTTDEINLLEMLITLWEGKITVALVAFLCGCLGVSFFILFPKHIGEFTIRGPVGASLAAYAPLNDEVKKHYGDFTRNTGDSRTATNQFEISTEGLVEDMVRELQDYSEFESALREYSPKIRDMSANEFSDERNDILAKFRIALATDSNPSVHVTFEWHNESQLLDILTSTLLKAEENLNATKSELLTGLADNIERRTLSELRSLDQDLLSVMESVDLETKSRLIFLKEQAAIARELDLAENKLAEGGQSDHISFSILPGGDGSRQSGASKNAKGSSRSERPDRPIPEALYLRGYKSLEKEVALIESRTHEQNYLLNPFFLETKRQAIELKHNTSEKVFREAINTSPFAARSNIFNIDRDGIRVKSKRNLPLILAASVLLGFLASCTFVLIKDALYRHQQANVS